MTNQYEYADYEKLLASLSHKAFRRATAKGFFLEFEELFQAAKETFVVAGEMFDPEQGVKFSTYLWTAVKNNLSRMEKKAINIQSQTSSLDAEIGDEVGTMHDIVPNNDETAIDRLLRLEEEYESFSKLSEKAKSVILVLDSPPAELAKELRRMEAFRLHCKENKMAAAARVLDVQTVCKILGYSVSQTRLIKQEFKALLEPPAPAPPMLNEPCYSCGAVSEPCDVCQGAMKIGDILYG